jgi:hypothetical protein
MITLMSGVTGLVVEEEAIPLAGDGLFRFRQPVEDVQERLCGHVDPSFDEGPHRASLQVAFADGPESPGKEQGGAPNGTVRPRSEAVQGLLVEISAVVAQGNMALVLGPIVATSHQPGSPTDTLVDWMHPTALWL